MDQHGSPVLGSQTPPATKSKEQGKELKSSEIGKTTGGNGDGDCVSMESMVNLPSTALEAHYRAGLAHLKAGKVNQGLDKKFKISLPNFSSMKQSKAWRLSRKVLRRGRTMANM